MTISVRFVALQQAAGLDGEPRRVGESEVFVEAAFERRAPGARGS